ncbi:MAG: sodium/solute symporter [Aestuariibacter sp.]|uniref:sodium:solute symporter n=1 Tax=Marisediminitalea aggregata TaxID=634436 RepID=UPI0020CD5A95|nr:sodium:solute symporter [Marisediminitalea aggregata]MCP4527871.1 sodium/solute symporter [Aestuariibacter sp.]MCP4949388.1 sodium/solute symporter [Aestuariibacter sp.]MCP9477840.1 sodium:solute symporter [Marisediminitalea aggregata]
MLTQYTSIDLLLFALYGLLLAVSGWYFNRKAATTSDYFLGGNAMPIWMVAISVLATSQSAATFLGGPDQGYRGNLTYLATNLGAFIAAFFVARFLIPRFYALNVYTVYELLENRFGESAKQQAGLMYLFGRVFASGARLYMAALAVAMILFGNIDASSVISATLLISIIGLVYSVYGGIRTVIYSDVMQAFTYISAAVAVIIALWLAIPADFNTVIQALQSPADGPSKLLLFDTRTDFSPGGVFTLLSVFTGFVLLNIAAFGLDQDMTQRVLTCKNAQEGAKAMLLSVVMVIPVMLLFIIIGLLLYVYYQRPDIMSMSNGAPVPEFAGEPVTIFMYYVLTDLPTGLKGLVTIGILAAALSTLNSGLNSMSSVLIQDLYRPWKLKRHASCAEEHFVSAGRIAMAFVALALALMACLCYYWQQYSDTPLLQFALGVMVFSYSGLLGVYFITLFTQRGSPASVLAALIVGFIIPLLLQPYIMEWYLPESLRFSLGFTWQLVIGTLIAGVVCAIGQQTSGKTWQEANVQC